MSAGRMVSSPASAGHGSRSSAVRAPGCGPGGRGFKSPRLPKRSRRAARGPVRSTRLKAAIQLTGEAVWAYSSDSGRLRHRSERPLLAPLAQLAEQRTLNPQVLGSSPRGRTNPVGMRIRTPEGICELWGRSAYRARPPPMPPAARRPRYGVGHGPPTCHHSWIAGSNSEERREGQARDRSARRPCWDGSQGGDG